MNELFQLLEIADRSVGYGAQLHLARAPSEPVIALPRAGAIERGLAFLIRPHKNVDEVLPPPVHQDSNIMRIDDVEPATNQRKSLRREVSDWRNEIQLAVK